MRHIGPRTLATAMLLTTAVPGMAQQAPDKDDPNAIVVTAQRREQKLQDVPIAVSAVTADMMTRNQITSSLDVARLVPNFIANNNTGIGSANTYIIRGLSGSESLASFDPPVGTYIDDIYIARQSATNFSFFDIDRIEVLRGPQGTLFGRNTTGGALNVILKKPSDQLTGYGELAYGRFNRVQARASIDLPISPSVLTKFSAYGGRADGYIHNLTTGERNNPLKEYGVRGAVRLLPSDSVTWDIALDHTYSDTLNLVNVKVDGRRVNRTGTRNGVAAWRGIITGRKQNFEPQNKTWSTGLTSNLAIETDGPTIAVISGLRYLKQGYAFDLFNGTPATGGYSLINASTNVQFSQEVKANGSLFGDSLDYVVGAFYLYERSKSDFADVFGASALVLADRVFKNSTSAPAIYGQFDWHLTDRLTATAGARYTYERRDFTLRYNDNPRQSVKFDTSDIMAFGIPDTLTASKVTPHFGLQYKFDPDLMLYASATKGFKSGGWNARAMRPELFLNFGPEKVWSYEGGMRSQWLDRRLTFNATGFYSNVMDYQIPTSVLNSSGVNVFSLQNAADIEIYGLELETNISPIHGLNLFANAGLLHAKYKNPNPSIAKQLVDCRAGVAGKCGVGIVAPNGNLAQPTKTPKLTLSLGGNYDIPIGDFLLTPSANVRHESQKWAVASNVPVGSVPSIWILGAGLTFQPADGPWSISVDCTNCTGKTYLQAAVLPALFVSPPAQWMGRVRYRF